MKSVVAAVLIGLFVAPSAHAFKQEDLDKLKKSNTCVSCDLRLADLTNVDLRTKADLRGADLRWANLNDSNLRNANLSGADLRWAKISGADLRDANLGGANLNGANLDFAMLSGSVINDETRMSPKWHLVWDVLNRPRPNREFIDADLSRADLSGARLPRANLSDTDLAGAQLNDADLSGANLIRAALSRANLNGANLSGADLSEAGLREADLSGANLIGANLSEADLRMAKLIVTRLGRADLTKANLNGAILRRANLTESNLSQTNLTEADLLDVVGLSEIHWTKLPRGIYGVREALKKEGERQAERELTYSIMHNRRITAGGVEGAFNYILFEVTSDFGMSPGRPLIIMVALIFVFSLVYCIGLSVNGDSGIWKIWSDERILKNRGSDDPERVTAGPWVRWVWALYFSFLSAFHIGWRDLNVGNWIVRMQPREYTLHATGWVRTVSGIQSLVSVYLVALSVLTYFGRPFE